MTTRELYLNLRQKLIRQAEKFMIENCDPEDDSGKRVMTYSQFQKWLNLYPFIRTQIRESLMPRMWSLNSEQPGVR